MQKINEIISLVLGSFLVAAVFLATAQAQEDPVTERLEKRSAEVREQFPDVRHIEPEDLLALDKAPFLIDVREADEYAVSRLPGAYHAGDEKTLLALAEQAGDRPLVVYCSLGVRSSRAAQLLSENGYTALPISTARYFAGPTRGDRWRTPTDQLSWPIRLTCGGGVI